ncbi:hypothetical protein Tco_0769554 [Tanacetum coccineum]|uniref:Uncharacterized protein n=1 Tax=Tanacetum coccineum TaxID=301880 RepID=A0ABQ4ZDM5_9ASTR
MLPPNYALSGMKQIKNDYHTNVMYDIAKVAGKLRIFIAHTPIDLSTVLIPNDDSFKQSLAGVISKETKIKLEESLKYLNHMQKRKNKKFDYYGLWGELAQYKLEIYIDHIGVNFVIHKYIFPNASLAEMINHVITDYSSENEGIIRQVTQNDYTSDQMVEWAEQEHFEYEETKVSCSKIDLRSMLIYNNRSKEESFGASNPENVRLIVLMKLQEALDEEAILEEQILTLMHRFPDRFTDRRVEINNLMVLHDHPLIDYGSSLLTQRGIVDLLSGHAMIDATHHKRVKYEAKCSSIGYGFLPFSFSSLGELENDADALLKRIRKFSVTQEIGARDAVHIFNRINFAITKGVRAQIVSRVPTNFL